MSDLAVRAYAILLLQAGYEDEATELMETIEEGSDVWESPLELAKAIELDTGVLAPWTAP